MALRIVETKIETKLLHCRFCAEVQQNESFINFNFDEDIVKEVINFTKSLRIDYLDISNANHLPKTLCSSCLSNIKAFNNFLSKIEQSQIVLNNIYSIAKEETHIELEIKIEDETETNIKFELENIDVTNDSVADTSKILHPESFTEIEVQNIEHVKHSLQSHKLESDIKPQLKVETVKKIKGIEKNNVGDDSWTGYNWICMQCRVSFETMNALRNHKRTAHKTCHRFLCMHCRDKVELFNQFIEHVRDHKPSLRYYCQYCNQKFETITKCSEHTATHLLGREVCEACGEILIDSSALKQHNKEYKKSRLVKNIARVVIKDETLVLESGAKASWADYNWACQVCCQRLPDVDTLRRHCQEVHNKCFAMKCMDCSIFMRNFESFVKHVRIHRLYLKHFCEYCNENIKENLLTRHLKIHKMKSNNLCPGCGQTFKSSSMLKEHMKQYFTPRPAKSLTVADLTCNVCGNHFKTYQILKTHLKIHDNRSRDYTCDACGAAFFNLGALTCHKRVHREKTQVCKVCRKAFHTRGELKLHVGIHLKTRPFQCDDCGKNFLRKDTLKNHMAIHNNVKPYACKECGKAFRFHSTLVQHSRQHTGERPYACEFCDRTFVDFGNCHKHMLGKHGVPLSKKKEKQIPVDDATKEWINTLVFENQMKV